MMIVNCLMLMAIVASARAQKPNFILIMTDDQGFDDYGFRQPPLETPHMDKLADEGVQFTRFYTAAACAPTRSALMTGRNFMRTGTASVGFGGDAPHLDEYLIGEAMQEAGYVTGMAGKWNLGTSDADMPNRRGFDETWELAAEENRSWGRFEYFKAPFFKDGIYHGIEEGWQVERVTDRAIDFIERHKDEPFFLYLPYAPPHSPWICPKEFQEKYMRKGIGEYYALFLGMMDQLDTQVGRILETLNRHGLSDDTIVLFFGDNGPTQSTSLLQERSDGSFARTSERYILSETEWAARNPSGFRSQKATGWENALRNRLSIYCPAKFRSKEVRDFTLVMDIYPTLLDLAGAQRKKDAPRLDGMSLRPLLELEGDTDWPKKRKYLTGETGAPASFLAEDGWYYRFTKEHSMPMDKRSSCFVLNHWVVVNDKGEWGLFNLRSDPQQKKDLKAIRPEKFAALQQKYNNTLQHVRNDPHAWSDPVQIIGLPGVDEPYLEMSYAYRMKGRNSVTWSNTFFREVGAIQEIKLRVLESASYKISLFARKVPDGTRVRLRVGSSVINAVLDVDEDNHELGRVAFKKGNQTMALTVLECDDLDALPDMEVYNLRLAKVAGGM